MKRTPKTKRKTLTDKQAEMRLRNGKPYFISRERMIVIDASGLFLSSVGDIVTICDPPLREPLVNHVYKTNKGEDIQRAQLCKSPVGHVYLKCRCVFCGWRAV
jgi:hypothetical protein